MFLKFSKTRWAVFFACLSMFILGLSDNIRGPLFPELLRYFDISNTQASLSFGVASFAAFSGNLISTFLLKRIHLDRLLALAILFMSLGLFAMGSAGSYQPVP